MDGSKGGTWKQLLKRELDIADRYLLLTSSSVIIPQAKLHAFINDTFWVETISAWQKVNSGVKVSRGTILMMLMKRLMTRRSSSFAFGSSWPSISFVTNSPMAVLPRGLLELRLSQLIFLSGRRKRCAELRTLVRALPACSCCRLMELALRNEVDFSVPDGTRGDCVRPGKGICLVLVGD